MSEQSNEEIRVKWADRSTWFMIGAVSGMLFTIAVFIASYFYFNPL